MAMKKFLIFSDPFSGPNLIFQMMVQNIAVFIKNN